MKVWIEVLLCDGRRQLGILDWTAGRPCRYRMVGVFGLLSATGRAVRWGVGVAGRVDGEVAAGLVGDEWPGGVLRASPCFVAGGAMLGGGRLTDASGKGRAVGSDWPTVVGSYPHVEPGFVEVG